VTDGRPDVQNCDSIYALQHYAVARNNNNNINNTNKMQNKTDIESVQCLSKK